MVLSAGRRLGLGRHQEKVSCSRRGGQDLTQQRRDFISKERGCGSVWWLCGATVHSRGPGSLGHLPSRWGLHTWGKPNEWHRGRKWQ